MHARVRHGLRRGSAEGAPPGIDREDEAEMRVGPHDAGAPAARTACLVQQQRATRLQQTAAVIPPLVVWKESSKFTGTLRVRRDSRLTAYAYVRCLKKGDKVKQEIIFSRQDRSVQKLRAAVNARHW